MTDERDPIDRDAILRRRAIFVTTAIAAFGCSSPDSPTRPSASDSASASAVEIPTPQSATAAATVTPTAKPAGSWDEVLAAAPPNEVPASLPPPEREELSRLAEKTRTIYEDIGRVWRGGPPACSPRDSQCEPWKAAAAVVSKHGEGLNGPMCGFYQGAAYIQRFLEHRAYIKRLVSQLDADFAAASAPRANPRWWSELVASSVQPQPCLDCSMPRVPALMATSAPFEVAFEEGKSKLTPAGLKALALVKEALAKDSEAHEVRGHADAGEPGDKEALARARAAAARDWLVKNGVAAARLKAVGYGASLAIASARSDAGRARNRRVDFEAPSKRRG